MTSYNIDPPEILVAAVAVAQLTNSEKDWRQLLFHWFPLEPVALRLLNVQVCQSLSIKMSKDLDNDLWDGAAYNHK